MSEPAMKFKIHSVDRGFCRVNYVYQTDEGAKVYFCLQDEGAKFGNVILYASNRELEPSHPVKMKDYIDKNRAEYFEKPEPTCELTEAVCGWIDKEV